MKTLDIEILLNESFYQESQSPILPIPFSDDDMKIMLKSGISMSVITDNLLQMIDQHPEKSTEYKPLIVYGCLNAGGSAASEGNFEVSKHYFLLASDFAPEDLVVRQNLARSYQQLSQYSAAIDNYLFVVQHATQATEGLLETLVCMIECFYANNEKDMARKLAGDLMTNITSQPDEAVSRARETIDSILVRDHADEIVRDYFCPD
jgi:hypothetical protein